MIHLKLEDEDKYWLEFGYEIVRQFGYHKRLHILDTSSINVYLITKIIIL